MTGDGVSSPVRGIWFGWPLTHRLQDWRTTLDWMAGLGFNALVYPVCYQWNALAYLPSVPELMAKNVIRASYWSPERSERVSLDGPPPMSAPGAFPSLVAEAAERGIEVIPQVSSFGLNSLLAAAYPEIRAQGPADPARVICTSHSSTIEILFRMYQNVLDQYPQPPRFFHVAMDEVWEMCECPACRAQGPVGIYAAHVNRIHGFFAPRGIRMIMFDDMLRPKWFRYDGPHCPFESDDQIASVLDDIPKDIAMHMWKYTWPVTRQEMAEGTAWFVSRGFEVFLGPGHHAHGAQLLFDASTNATTMLGYGLGRPDGSNACGASGVIAYSPHIFPQEPYYHTLAEKMRSGRDDGGLRFLRAVVGVAAESLQAALTEVTECYRAAPMAADRLPLVVNHLLAQDFERRDAVYRAGRRMAQAVAKALALLEGVPTSPEASRLAAGFVLAQTVASRLRMAEALLEGKQRVFAALTKRDLAAADAEFTAIASILEGGLQTIERALLALEPVASWDRHVVRLLCLLTTEMEVVEVQLRLLETTRRGLDDVLHHRDALPWWPWPPQWYQE